MTIAQSNASLGICGASVRSPTIVACGLPSVRHQDVDALDVGAEAGRVVGGRDLEDAAADVGGVRADELLDVDAVDRRARARTPSSGRSASCGGGRRGRRRAAAAPVRRTAARQRRGAVPGPAAGRSGVAFSWRPPSRRAIIGRRGRAPTSRDGRRRIVVVSPHLDDGVLSLGASIASWAAAGAAVELLTVLGCDPDSTAPPGAGTGAAASRPRASRRARGARRIVGRAPCSARRRCGFRSAASTTSATATRAMCVAPSSAAARRGELVLLPGFPLTHPDHAWLVRTLDDGAGRSPHRALRRAALHAARRDANRTSAWVAERSVGGAFEPVPDGAARPAREVVGDPVTTARSSRCSGCGGACGVARSATRLLPNGSPGAPD